MPIRIVGDDEFTYNSQLASDNARDLTLAYSTEYANQPEVAAFISANKAAYPWLPAGAALPLARARQGPESPLAQSLARAAAQHRARKNDSVTGIGVWAEAGEWSGKLFGWLGRNVAKPVGKALGEGIGHIPGAKPVVRYGFGALFYPIEGLENIARDIYGDIQRSGLRGLVQDDPSAPRMREQSALHRALPTFLGGQGESLGSGYLPQGEARENSVEAQREQATIAGQNLTLGRLTAYGAYHLTGKTIFEPGSKAYNALSGTVDFAKLWYADPTNAALKSAAAAKEFNSLIDPGNVITRTPGAREAQARAVARVTDSVIRDAKALGLDEYAKQAGLIRGNTRNTINDNAAFGWASTGDGAKVMNYFAETNDTYKIMKDTGIDIETARRMADTRTANEALDVFQDRFLAGVLRTKPNVPRKLSATTREHHSSIRMFSSFPRETQALRSDLDQSARMIEGQLKNVKMGDRVIGYYVDRIARVQNNDEFDSIISDLVTDMANRSAGQVDHAGIINGTNRSIKLGDKVYTSEELGRGEVISLGTRELPAPVSDPGTLPYDLTENIATVRFRPRGEPERVIDLPLDSLSVHLPITRAREVARFNPSALRDEFASELANRNPRNIVIGPDGVVHDLSPAGPYAEYLTGAVTMPNIREMRRISSEYGRFINNHAIPRHTVDLLDAFRNLWVPATLLKMAGSIRNVAEGQARWAASGFTTGPKYAGDHIAMLLAKDSRFARGDYQNYLAHSEQFRTTLAHIGSGNLDRGVQFNTEIINASSPRFTSQWGDSLVTFSRNPLFQKFAGNWDDVTWTRTGSNLDDAKKWWWQEEVPRLRQRFDSSRLPSHLKTRAAADKYVDEMFTHFQHYTRGDLALIETVARGTINGAPAYTVNPQSYASLTDELTSYLSSQRGLPNTPTWVHGAREVDPLTASKSESLVTSVFNFLWGRPMKWFVVNPSLNKAYFSRSSELLPLMTKEAQAEFLKLANDAGLSRPQLRDLASNALKGSGDLTFKEADLAAKIHATETARKTFYDLHNRSQFADLYRHIFPFFDAWKDMLTTWSKIAVNNPRMIRRFQTVIEGARGSDNDPSSGFFTIDPQTGEEMFNFPGTEFVTKATLGVPVPMRGSVAGLNMFSSTPLYPGVGPIVQIPMSRLIPDKPDTDWIRKMISPYGETTVGNTLTPPWFDKIFTALFHDEYSDRKFANAQKDAARYLMSTGDYHPNNPESMRALEDKSRALAKSVYFFRGLFQWLSPSPPSPDWRAYDESGRLLSQYKMSQEFHEMIDEYGVDNATAAFLTKFGDKNLLIMQASTSGQSARSQATYDYIREHPDILRLYPDSYGYFAPTDDRDAPYEAYLSALEKGTRTPLTFKQWTERANDRVGSMIYYTQKDQFGPRPTPRQQEWLSGFRDYLATEYPGFDPMASDPGKRKRTIQQFYEAAAAGDLNATPAGRGIATYLAARDQAIAKARAGGIKGWENAKKTRSIRAWLRKIGAQLSTQYPGFDRAWESVFSREFIND